MADTRLYFGDILWNTQNWEMFTEMYYNTDPHVRTAIEERGELSVINGGTPFCCTLWKGDLPTITPYGSERLIMSIDDVWNLFESPALYQVEDRTDGGKRYITYELRERDDAQGVPGNEYLQRNASGEWFVVPHKVAWVTIKVNHVIPLTPENHRWEQM